MILGGLLSLIGSGIKGFFGFKGSQAKAISSALDVVGDMSKSDDARAVAAAQIISAEARSESWLTRMWRPLTVIGFVGILFSFFFGYSPENVTPEMIDRIFDIVEFSIFGYMGSRTIEKLIRELSIGSTLKQFISKRVS